MNSLRFLHRLLPPGLILGFALLTGCTSSEISVPSRSALEQLLLSTATDNALKGLEIPQVAGEKVYLEDAYVESYDEDYVVGSIRALLSENGALLTDDRDDADVIVEARVGALGMDSAESLLGIPSLPLPIPSVGTIETPEAALYASKKKDSVAKIALLGYRKDGTGLFSTEPISGKAY
ncbi:MAG: hypothetical protein GVY10_12190, partial [Verrucomicrobia bacterium]|nr:hypothetical protein [Verrucomicrobiota bacterium]